MKGQLVLALVLLAGLCGFACSRLIDAEPRVIRCIETDGAIPNICPDGLTCYLGECLKCEDREYCDGLDNNCDGIPDNGYEVFCDKVDNDCDQKVDEGSDKDGDGFSWCGDVRGVPDAAPIVIDCNDDDPKIAPGAPETCDGQDSNCNEIDEQKEGAICEGGQRCVDGRCVTPSCAIPNSGISCKPDEECNLTSGGCQKRRGCTTDAECLAQEQCDPFTGTCVAPERARGIGEACIQDDDCDSKLCIDAAALRLSGGATRVCGEACCTDATCGDGERCLATGTGARSCFPSSKLPGLGQTSQCVNNGTCGAQACALTRDTVLPTPTFQALDGGVVASTCRTPDPGDKKAADACESYTDCESQACAPLMLFNNSVCAPTCGSDRDCTEFATKLRARTASMLPRAEGAHCGYVPIPTTPYFATRCIVRPFGTPNLKPDDAECTRASECASGGCVTVNGAARGYCAKLCCDNSQCGRREDGSARTCRPFAFGARYEMRCSR